VKVLYPSRMTGKRTSVGVAEVQRYERLTPDISGFYFLEGDTDFKPDDELAKFLEDGEAPVYIG